MRRAAALCISEMRRWSTYLQKSPTYLQKSHTYLHFSKEPYISAGALCISADMRRRWSHISATYISSSTLHPRTEEIRLNIFGFPDLPDFRVDLFSDGNSVSSREMSYEILGTPVKTCLMCTGTPVKTCWSFWQS